MTILRDLSEELHDIFGLEFSNEIHELYVCSEGPQGGTRWSLLLGDLDQKFFNKFIQHKPRFEQQFTRNASNGLIKRARNQLDQYLRNKISDMAAPLEYLKLLYKCLTKHVVMIAIEVETEREAMNVFERINARGKPLSLRRILLDID